MTDEHDDRGRDDHPEKTPGEARQGERGPSMLLVLGIGVAGVVIAYALVGWLNSDDDSISLSVIEGQTQEQPATVN